MCHSCNSHDTRSLHFHAPENKKGSFYLAYTCAQGSFLYKYWNSGRIKSLWLCGVSRCSSWSVVSVRLVLTLRRGRWWCGSPDCHRVHPGDPAVHRHLSHNGHHASFPQESGKFAACHCVRTAAHGRLQPGEQSVPWKLLDKVKPRPRHWRPVRRRDQGTCRCRYGGVHPWAEWKGPQAK